jgi:hypothetical protein
MENDTMLVKDEIVRRLDHLPEPKLQEVLSFVEFLMWKTEEVEEDPVLSVAGTLSGKPLSAHEIEQVLYGEEEID